MNPDTLHKVQVAAFWAIAIALIALDLILVWLGFKLDSSVTSLLQVLEEIGRAL